MSATNLAPTSTVTDPASAALQGRLRVGYFALQALNSLASSYYFNYLFFYLQEHFGFGNRDNLLVTVLYGFTYTIAAWYAGPIGQKIGYFRTLGIGFAGMGIGMALAGIAPRVFGYTHVTVVWELVIEAGWTISVCLTWPTLQYLLTRYQTPAGLARTAGLYNIGWSSTAAFAYLTSGVLMDHFGGEILFWLAVAIHLIQILMLPRLEKMSRALKEAVGKSADLKMIEGRGTIIEHEPNPKARHFLRLALIANPVAYVAVYGLIPVIPVLAERFALSATTAGLICSIWFWTRLGSFIWFWQWTGWHYQFRWLMLSFLAMIVSFVAILIGHSLWLLALAQVIFGIAISLIYYSSLFYSMDAGASKGKRGGIHEAAIGVGVFMGPAAGVAALHFFPHQMNAATAGMSLLLVIGLGIFLWARLRDRNAKELAG